MQQQIGFAVLVEIGETGDDVIRTGLQQRLSETASETRSSAERGATSSCRRA